MLIPVQLKCVQFCGFLCVAYYSSDPTHCDVFTENPPHYATKKEIFPTSYPYIREAVACPSIPEPWTTHHDGYTFYFSDNCQTIQEGVLYDQILPVMHPTSAVRFTRGSVTGPCPILQFSGDDVSITIDQLSLFCTNDAPAITLSNSTNVTLTIVGVVTNASIGLSMYNVDGSTMSVNIDGPSTSVDANLLGGDTLTVQCNTYQKVKIFEITSLLDVEITPTLCKFSSMGSTGNTNLLHDYPEWQPVAMREFEVAGIWTFVVVLLIFITKLYLK